MAITTTIARHYAWRCLIISFGSLIFGLWGVYDYVWSIPGRERAYERGQVVRLVKDALEPGRWSEHGEPAKQAVEAELNKIREAHFGNINEPDRPLNELTEEELEALSAEVSSAMDSLREKHDEGWLAALALFAQALQAGEPRHPLEGVHLAAYDVADRGSQVTATVKPPSALDRPTQWIFMTCLPFFPLYLWFYIDTKRRVYRLDDDGTLHSPGGTWPAAEIADIDMSDWMRKSIAYVIHESGARLKLDDYKHRNLHLIVGAIASRFYPEKWDAEARVVKSPMEEAPADAESAA